MRRLGVQGCDAPLTLLFFVALLPLLTKASPWVSMKYSMRASLCAVAVLALGLSIRAHSRR